VADTSRFSGVAASWTLARRTRRLAAKEADRAVRRFYWKPQVSTFAAFTAPTLFPRMIRLEKSPRADDEKHKHDNRDQRMAHVILTVSRFDVARAFTASFCRSSE